MVFKLVRISRSPTIVACAVTLVFAATVLDLTTVHGNSMENTLLDGDRLLILRVGGLSSVPWIQDLFVRHGAIVICRHPARAADLIVKRVVATSNENVRVDEMGVLVNEKRPPEAATVRTKTTAWPVRRGGDSLRAITVPPGHFFVLSDHRLTLLDSRLFGSIQRNNIIGVVLGVIYRPRQS